MQVVLESAALNADMSVGWAIYRSDWDGLIRFDLVPCFFWRQAIECLVWPNGIVPSLVLIKTLLEATRCCWPQCWSLPQPQCFEEAFDFAIEGECADLPSHMLDA